MRDGKTRRLAKARAHGDLESFLADHAVKLVAVSGRNLGAELVLRDEVSTLGRGPGVDFALEDPAMSRQHAAIEFAGGEFRVRDLGSTNGVLLNGRPVQVDELRHGDRIEIGSQEFQFLVEMQDEGPDVYELTSEA